MDIGWGAEREESDESREQKGESGVVGPEAEKPPKGCRVRAANQIPPEEEDQGKCARQVVVGGAGQASLVRVKLKTGSRGKYKAEPAAGCGTLRQCNPEEIFTAGNLHTGKKLSWLLRGGNCMLLGPDLLSAVLGWDCDTHTHTGVTVRIVTSRRFAVMQKW